MSSVLSSNRQIRSVRKIVRTMFTKKPTLAQVSPAKAAEWVRTGRITLVDVREAAERVAAAPGVPSIHIPLESLPERLSEVPADRPVAFICAAGGRSAKAARLGSSAGLDVWNVTGGMGAWLASGQPTKSGS